MSGVKIILKVAAPAGSGTGLNDAGDVAFDSR